MIDIISRFFLYSIFLLLAAMTAHGRSISGTVVGEGANVPVADARCSLSCNGLGIASTSTDSLGRFEVDIKETTALDLLIEKEGYADVAIMIDAANKDRQLGRIEMTRIADLQEVVVEGATRIDKAGKNIVFPSATQARASSSSTDLFLKLTLPGMTVDPITRSIDVDGGVPVIQINSMPATMQDFYALKPEQILKIEYSRVAPAKYADKGRGLINIVLKEKVSGGQFFGNLESAFTTGFLNGQIYSSFNHKASQFTLNYSPSWRNYQDAYDNSTQSYIGKDFSVEQRSEVRRPFHYINHPIYFKYTYRPKAGTYFIATFYMNIFSDKRSQFGKAHDSFYGNYDIDNSSRSRSYTPSLDLFFHHDFSAKSSLEIDVRGSLLSDTYKRDNTFDISSGQQDYRIDIDSRTRSLVSNIDYTHSFNDRFSLSTGYQNSLSGSKNEYATTDYSPTLSQNNNRIYVGTTISFSERLYAYLSTGLKIFDMKNDDDKRTFVRNQTQMQLGWYPSQNWNMSFQFYYGPSIPSLADLTDYRQQTTPFLISNGNPDLKASDNLQYYLSAGFRHKKLSLTLSANVNHVINPIFTNYTYLGEHHFLTRTENYSKYLSYGATLDLGLQGIYGFGFNGRLGFTRYETKGADFNLHLNSLGGYVSLYWNRGPFTVAYYRNFPSRYLSGTVKGKSENADYLQLTYKPSQAWTLQARWMYMFCHKGTQYPSWNLSPTAPSYIDSYIRDNNNMVTLSVTYNILYGKRYKEGNRRIQSEGANSSILKL